MKALFSIKEVSVRFNEVDSMNIVWHGNYVKYLEDGREDFGKKHGIDYLKVQKLGFTIPIVDLEIHYRKSLYYGDTVLVKTIFVPMDSAKLVFKYELLNPETSELICSAKTTQVFLDNSNKIQLITPLFFQNWKSKWLLSGPTKLS